MKKLKRHLISVILFTIILLIFFSSNDNSVSLSGVALKCNLREEKLSNGVKIIRVIDGDTVELENGKMVRLIYVNTPERGEEFYELATEFTKSFCLNKRVKLRKYRSEKDKYGRIIADIIMDGKSLSENLIIRGFAHLFLIPPFDLEKAKRLEELQKVSKSSRKGLWNSERFKGPLHITSFRADAEGDDRFNLNGEYLRIVNIGDETINLKDFKLTNSKGLTYIFPSLQIPVGHTVLVFSGEGNNQTDYKRGQLELYWNLKYPAWSNKGDKATLSDNNGNVVQRKVYFPYKFRK